MIGFLTNRIKEENGKNAYYYCRHLTNLCNLLEDKKNKKVKLTKVNSSKIGENMSLQTDLPYHQIDDEVEQLSMDKVYKKEGI